MATSVTFKGVTYSLPAPGETDDWGAQLTAFLTALAANQTTVSFVGATSAAGGIGVNGVSTGATGRGVVGSGSADSDSIGVVGLTQTGTGVLGQALDSGTGCYGLSANGYGVIAGSDQTSPTKSALRVVPQDSTPTGPNAVGDIYVTTAGVLKICTVAGTPGTFVSVGSQT